MALRMIELTVPRDALDQLTSTNDSLDVMDSWLETLHDGVLRLRVLVKSEHSESIVSELESRFRGLATFRLVIFEVAATVPAPDSESENKDSMVEGSDDPEVEPERVACAELVEDLSSGATINRAYVVTVILSAVVAAIGLMRNNVAVIIGAMVIAPLLAPNMTLALATTLGDLKLARRAIGVNATGLALALAVAVLAGLSIPFDASVSEIASRTSTSLSDIVLALAAGTAGALAFTTGVSATLVGVMVAVALVPPLVVAGLLVGTGEWGLSTRAFLLVATNIICINLAGVGTFLFQKVRPKFWWEAERAKKIVRIAGVVWVVLFALLVGLVLLAQE